MKAIEFKDFKQDYIAKGDYHYKVHGFSRWFLHWNYRMLVRGLSEEDLVLDVACGDGALENLHPRLRVVGLDFSVPALSLAKKHNGDGRRHFVCSDMRTPPFQSGTFDAVVSSLSLQYLDKDDFASALGEFRRILRPGGKLVFSYINPDHRLNKPHIDRLAAAERPTTLALELHEIRDIVPRAGFRLDRVCGTNLPLNYKAIPGPLRRLAFELSKLGRFFPASAYHNVFYASKS